MNSALEHAAKAADDLFSLACPDAPGALFCGAMFTAGGIRFPAGAADIDPANARVRCLGEIAETLAQFTAAQDLSLADPGHGLAGEEWQALEDMAGNATGQWLAATRLADGKAASVPAALCLRSEGVQAGLATSLGCAAGETGQTATGSALFELIERDAVALWWQGGVPPMQIPDMALPAAKSFLAQARQGLVGRQTVFIGLQSIANVPAICAFSFDDQGKGMALGFGSAATHDAAASKALMEMLQMEVGNRFAWMKAARLGDDGLQTADRAILERLSILEASMPPFQTSGTAPSLPERPWAIIAANLGALGVNVFAVNLHGDPLGVPVVKLIAPGLQPLPGRFETDRLAAAKKTHAMRLRHFPKVAIL